MNSETVAVGYARKAHGLKGEVFIRLFAGRADWLEHFDTAILTHPERLESTLQLSVIQASPHKDGLIVTLDRVTDRDGAEALVGYQLLIPQEWLISTLGETPFLHELVGFEVIDGQIGSVGRIDSFASNGAQDIFVIKRGDREVLIPFIKPFVEQMDFANKTIHMNLPQGLVE